MAERLGLSSHVFILLIIFSLAALLVSCAPQPTSNRRVWQAYSTVLPIYVSPSDTQKTKEQVYKANSLHEGVGRGATGSP